MAKNSIPEADNVANSLKKKARRRLIGAIALVLLALVVLPKVMNSEVNPQIDDIVVIIPGENSVGVLSPKPKNTNEASANNAAAKPEIAAVKVDAPKTSISNTEIITNASPTTQDAIKEDEKAAKDKKAEQAKIEAAKIETTKAEEARRAQAILSGKPAANKEAQYVILIGAYSNPSNVKNLEKKLGELKIKALTEAITSEDGSKKTRVRAGYFADKDAAEKALARMKKIGIDGKIVAK